MPGLHTAFIPGTSWAAFVLALKRDMARTDGDAPSDDSAAAVSMEEVGALADEMIDLLAPQTQEPTFNGLLKSGCASAKHERWRLDTPTRLMILDNVVSAWAKLMKTSISNGQRLVLDAFLEQWRKANKVEAPVNVCAALPPLYAHGAVPPNGLRSGQGFGVLARPVGAARFELRTRDPKTSAALNDLLSPPLAARPGSTGSRARSL